MTLAAGTRLGPYEIVAPLGAGGMGEVYRARDARLSRDVAVKVLPAQRSAGPEVRARFEREARVISSLNHPHICTLHDVGREGVIDFLVMELVEGETLAARLERGPLRLPEALRCAVQIADGLAAAHRVGVVHRDLKPGNIMLTKTGVKILDFGLAKAGEPDGAEGAGAGLAPTTAPTRSTPLTTQGAVLGTMQYMAPEQLEGKPVDSRADLFAFGAVLYEMVAGRRAFEGASQASVIAAILEREPRPLLELLPGVPPALDRTVRRCLAKDPDERWQNALDVKSELAWIAAGESGGVAGPAGAGRARPGGGRRAAATRAVLAAAFLAAGLVAGLLYGRQGRRAEPPTYHQLTFRRGFVHSARFAPDQQTVVYGAAFEGLNVALFSTRKDAVESRPLDLPGADIAGISRTGDMAILLGRHHVGGWLRVGTLASAALAGGGARPILDDVYDADISPDGQSYAVVRDAGSSQQLEYPIGHVVARSTGWISLPRISRDGRRVAFADHPFRGDDQGRITIADRSGRITAVSPAINYLQGLCWSPSGEEVWATGGESDLGVSLWTAAPGRPPRVITRLPGAFRIQDALPSGEVLMTQDDMRAEIVGRLAGDEREKSYSWWNDDAVGGISADGTVFAANASSFLIDGEYVPYFRRNDGQPPVRLGVGAADGITPDGRWVFTSTLSRDRGTLTLLPTGAGQPRRIDLGPVQPRVTGGDHLSFSADGRRVGFLGLGPDDASRAYVLDLPSGTPRPASPAGARQAILSPDGHTMAVRDSTGRLTLQPVEGGVPREVPGWEPREALIDWDASGGALLVWDQAVPPRILRLDLVTGRRSPSLELEPADPAGILYAHMTMTRDARHYLVRYRRVRNDLIVAKGLH